MKNSETGLPVVIITGTSRGIGKLLAEHYLSENFVVAGCSRSESAISHENFYHQQIDLSEERSIIEFIRNVTNKFGRIDVLINNAGIASMNHLMLTPLSVVEKIYRSNVFAPFILIREVSKIMSRAKSGRIINITSVASPLNLEGEAIYASSKAALESITRIASRELADFGITVNAIGPVPFDSVLIKTVPSDKIGNLISRQAIKRKAVFADISNVTDFFIQPSSNFITGQIIYLGGIN